MYHADLSTQESVRHYTLLSVGWLEEEHPYPRGQMSPHLIEKLKRLILIQPNIMLMRGVHTCSLGDGSYDQWMYVADGIDGVLLGAGATKKRSSSSEVSIPEGTVVRLLGHSDVWLPGLNDVIYSAPTLIYHYVVDHQYLPPQVYLEALEAYDFETSLDCQKLYDDYMEENMAYARRKIAEEKERQSKDNEAS